MLNHRYYHVVKIVFYIGFCVGWAMCSIRIKFWQIQFGFLSYPRQAFRFRQILKSLER